MESMSPEAFNVNLRGCFVRFGFWYFFTLASLEVYKCSEILTFLLFGLI